MEELRNLGQSLTNETGKNFNTLKNTVGQNVNGLQNTVGGIQSSIKKTLGNALGKDVNLDDIHPDILHNHLDNLIQQNVLRQHHHKTKIVHKTIKKTGFNPQIQQTHEYQNSHLQQQNQTHQYQNSQQQQQNQTPDYLNFQLYKQNQIQQDVPITPQNLEPFIQQAYGPYQQKEYFFRQPKLRPKFKTIIDFEPYVDYEEVIDYNQREILQIQPNYYPPHYPQLYPQQDYNPYYQQPQIPYYEPRTTFFDKQRINGYRDYNTRRGSNDPYGGRFSYKYL